MKTLRSMSLGMSDLRAAFPALDEGLCFLDWAATGLLSAPGRRDVEEFLGGLASCPDAAATWMHLHYAPVRHEVRARVARLLGAASPDDVALVENTTAGLAAAADSIPLSEGDNVLLSAIDYLAVATPWKQRVRRDGIELRYVPPRAGTIEPADVLERIDARTRVVALSTVCWTTGAVLDLEAIARETRMRGIILVVDATQSFGVAPLDLARIPAAFVACGGHKWLASLLGAGFLYVNPLIAARHPALRVGFLSGRPPRGTWGDWFQDPQSSPDEEIVFPATGRSFESGGTPSYPGALGLRASLELLEGTGLGVIIEHVRDLGDRLMEGLDDLGLEIVTPRARGDRAGIVTFRLEAGVEAERELVERLRERRIVVGVRYAGGLGGVRVSLHGPNRVGDVERLLEALRQLR
jgi:selenocysteine lyase/cysteine desulfurase